MIWFTSDLHLSHTNSIKHNNRPFASSQQMDEEIIKRWNKKIAPNDTVYVLGDVCWGWNSKRIHDTFSKMNGIKYLIIGNHDKLGPHQLSNVWAEITPYKRITIDNYRVILSHYPIADFDGMYHKSIHLYGHVHNNPSLMDYLDKTKYYAYNVGVDTNNYYPYSWDDIKQKLGLND